MNLRWVSSALASASVEASTLDPDSQRNLLERLRTQFDVDVTSRAPWDTDSAPEGRLLPDGWELITGYVDDRPCLMFLDGAQTIWRMRNGSDLHRVLKECPPMEFFICDEQASYLLCANHHDVVIGWGEATDWLQSLACE